MEWKGSVIGSEAFSSHADQNELIEWANDNRKIYLIHGEDSSKKALQEKLSTRGIESFIPKRNEIIEI